jgi:hypothetical protein
MPTKQRKTKQPDRPPLYDPAVHTDPDVEVFVELYCVCGALWRQRDPVSYVEPRVREFLAAHTGRMHGPASKATCIDAREARREAGFKALGRADYRRRDYPNLDTTDATVREWPAFPVPVVHVAAPAVPRRDLEGTP